MGTRADFYVGRGENAEWLGSIAWDGNTAGIAPRALQAVTEDEYRAAVIVFLASREDATTPEMGWPWPWENPQTTDYAYAFDGQVWVSCFGANWRTVSAALRADDADHDDEDWNVDALPQVAFPDMTSRQVVNFGKRSGVITIQAGGIVQ